MAGYRHRQRGGADVIANAFFMPSHLLSETPLAEVAGALADGAT